MKIKLFNLIKLALIIIPFFSCSHGLVNGDAIVVDLPVLEARVIPAEEALLNLEGFLSGVQMPKTRSGVERKVSTVETHYSSSYVTTSGDPMPDAYLVNFVNEEGFAVLGANSSVAPIIVVVEEGNTDWERLFKPLTKSAPVQVSPDTTDLRDLILGTGTEPELLLPLCVQSALKGKGSIVLETRSSTSNDISIPLLGGSHNFGQNVTYCHKKKNKFVTNGCASTAIAMIMSYLKFPRMVVDNNLLGYDNYNQTDAVGIQYTFSDDFIYIKSEDYFTNSGAIPSELTTQEKLDLLRKIDPDVIDSHGTPTVTDSVSFYRTRYKLTSAVYYTLDNAINNWTATGATPAAVVNGLEDIGFSNVSKNKTRELDSEQIATITDMLEAKKPVLICGWSLWSLDSSHYWVIDALKEDSGAIMIHCNWGHNGKFNGWVSSDCIRKEDSGKTKSSDSDSDNEWNNLVVFSYDVSGMPYLRVSTFYDEHRVTY